MASLQQLPDAASRRSRSSSNSGIAAGSDGRVPPHSLEAEESILGAALLSRDAVAVALEQVSAGDFYRPAHAHIFKAITALYARAEPADAVTVAEEMRRAGTLELAGGAAALLGLQANTPAISSAPRYARIVQEHSMLRKLIAVAYEIAELGYGLPGDVTAAIDQAEAMVFEVAQRRSLDSVRALKDLLTESLEQIEYLADRDEAITGVPTGYADLDRHLYGLQPSNLVVVGARPSVGKTAFALGLAAHAAARSNVPTLYFSLEMSHSEIAQRVLCSEARVDSGRVRNGKLLDSDWTKISSAIGRLSSAPLYIDENPNVTVLDIRAKSRRMKSTDEGLGLVVVDYLQLMTGRSSAESRQVEISEISRGLKILARELKIPVVALSQLSRNLEARADKRPMLADLRECLAGDTWVSLVGSDEEVTIGELARSRARNVPVWSVDDQHRVVRSVMTEAWSTGIKPVNEILLASGRTLRATSNHPLLTVAGWSAVAELVRGDHVAVARSLPEAVLPYDSSELELVLEPLSLQLERAQHPSARRDPTGLATPPGRAESTSLFWDEVIDVLPAGETEVFDARVQGTHCFFANDVVSHNSGAIEQDADVVMFLYRDEIYNPDSTDNRGQAEVIIAKHRNGPTGWAELAFVSNIARFGDLAHN